MRPSILDVTAAAFGVVVGVVLVVASLASSPVVILSTSAHPTVPPFEVDRNTTFICNPPGCGQAGILRVTFTTGFSSTLSGVVQASAPIRAGIANDPGSLGLDCGFSGPPTPCAPVAGTIYAYVTPDPITHIDLTTFPFNFNEGQGILPAGHWTVFFVNENQTAVSLIVQSALVAQVMW